MRHVNQSWLARWLLWAPPAGWAAFLFFLSSRTPAELPPAGWLPPGTDKVVHALLYAVLGVLLLRAFAQGSRVRGWRAVAAAAAAAVAYGAFDELHQAFVPGRSADLADLAADALGAALGAWVYRQRFIRPGRPQPASRPAGAAGRSNRRSKPDQQVPAVCGRDSKK
ncbi:MAG: hypothetical protein Kow0059_01870 [Candidatus Sumerlaeia bacterium]